MNNFGSGREKDNPMTEEKEEPQVLSEDLAVLDDTDLDPTVPFVQYEITSYGADIDTEGFVNRLRRDDVYIPPFQRDYVWSQREASRFVESLLLGLPVPGVFLARDRDSKRLLVIDGQQRLKTLEFFFNGYFNPESDAKRKRVFDLQGVQEQFEGKTYKTLNDDDRRTLNDSIIHATIVKQESPEGDQSSIYHIFERLNTSGRKLSPQQIRVAVYHGFVIDMLHRLNGYEPWRAIYGHHSKTLKDEELILRFLALYSLADKYRRPMKVFLNSFVESMIDQGEARTATWETLFKSTIDFIKAALGTHAFKPERAINAAVYDSVMVGTARRLRSSQALPPEAFAKAYNRLLDTGEYMVLVSGSTSDDTNVARRLKIATETFAELEQA